MSRPPAAAAGGDVPAIATVGLTKRYGRVAALTELSLTVPAGTIYGFLGPNGAGKTTAIRLLLGFIRASAGQARLFGRDAWRDGPRARRAIGYLVPPDAFYPDMTGGAQLDFLARLSGRPPVLRAELLEALELGREALGRKIGAYSKGMKQKLALIAAMQHDPPLLILDEPTEGLDPLIQRAFEGLLRRQRTAGRTIFMSSHDLAEVERTCERVAIVRAGRLVAEETIAELQRRRRVAEVRFAGPVPAQVATVPGVAVLERKGRTVRLAVAGEPNGLLRFLAGQAVEDLTIAPASLEEIFMAFYGPDEGPATDGRHPAAVAAGQSS